MWFVFKGNLKYTYGLYLKAVTVKKNISFCTQLILIFSLPSQHDYSGFLGTLVEIWIWLVLSEKLRF